MNNVNFKAIYDTDSGKYSPKQYVVRQNIIKKLRSPYKKGLSAEAFYAKKNMDFLISTDSKDTVTLSLAKNVQNGIGVDSEQITYEGEERKIGTYDLNHLFKTEDISNSKAAATDWSQFVFLPIALGLILLGVAKCTQSSNKLSREQDTIVNTVTSNLKSLDKDTVQLIKPVK